MSTKSEGEEEAAQNSSDTSVSTETKTAADDVKSASSDSKLKDVADEEEGDAEAGVHLAPAASPGDAVSEAVNDGHNVLSAADGAESEKAGAEVTLDRLTVDNDRRPEVGDASETALAGATETPVGNATGSQFDDQSEARESSELHRRDEREAPGDSGGVLLGKHQWSSEEEASLLAARLSQQADRDAFQRVVDEKVKVKVQLEDLQQRYSLLQEASAEWEKEISTLRETLRQQDGRAKELESEVAQLRMREYQQGEKDLGTKVKELQGRLVTLANSDAEKDARIKKLEEDLHGAKAQLLGVEAERRAGYDSGTVDSASAPLAKEPPQSKTCVVV